MHDISLDIHVGEISLFGLFGISLSLSTPMLALIYKRGGDVSGLVVKYDEASSISAMSRRWDEMVIGGQSG